MYNYGKYSARSVAKQRVTTAAWLLSAPRRELYQIFTRAESGR